MQGQVAGGMGGGEAAQRRVFNNEATKRLRRTGPSPSQTGVRGGSAASVVVQDVTVWQRDFFWLLFFETLSPGPSGSFYPPQSAVLLFV